MFVERPPFLTFNPGDFDAAAEEFDRVELKLDGWFCALEFYGELWRLFSRTSRLLHAGKIEGEPFRDRIVLYGEYIYGTEWAKDHPDLYGQFGIYGLTSENPTYEIDPRASAEYLITKRLEKPILNGLFLVEQYDITESAKLWEEEVQKNGYEGLVFKQGKSRWGATMGRMKRNETMDYVVMGFDQSDSDRYAGRGIRSIRGGLYVDGELLKVINVGGLNDELKIDMFRDPDKYIGRVFEAEGKKLSKRGVLRHPNFLRFREDKDPKECRWPR